MLFIWNLIDVNQCLFVIISYILRNKVKKCKYLIYQSWENINRIQTASRKEIKRQSSFINSKELQKSVLTCYMTLGDLINGRMVGRRVRIHAAHEPSRDRAEVLLRHLHVLLADLQRLHQV